MRYKLPELLGAGECAIVRDATSGSLWVQVEVGEGNEQIVIELARCLLTEVKPPLPEEPPINTVVVVDGEAVQRFDDDERYPQSWAGAGSPKRYSWVQLCDLALPGVPLLLVPDPFTEPVQLPWTCTAGDIKELTVKVVRDQVFISATDDGEHTVIPVPAKAMANALMTAADAAEKEQS